MRAVRHDKYSIAMILKEYSNVTIFRSVHYSKPDRTCRRLRTAQPASGRLVMLTTVQKPKTKQELIKALNQANVKTVMVYEGSDLRGLPSKDMIERSKQTVIIIG